MAISHTEISKCTLWAGFHCRLCVKLVFLSTFKTKFLSASRDPYKYQIYSGHTLPISAVASLEFKLEIFLITGQNEKCALFHRKIASEEMWKAILGSNAGFLFF